jgi:hypothetical protein
VLGVKDAACQEKGETRANETAQAQFGAGILRTFEHGIAPHEIS